MDRNEIKSIIPHREPFLFLDDIEVIEEGVKGIGTFHLTGEEDFFKGHFPQYKVMPGVLIVEALAQVGAVLLLSRDEFKGKIGFMGGLDKLRFKRKVFPGDTLTLEVEILRIKAGIGVGSGLAAVNGEKVVSGEILFAVG